MNEECGNLTEPLIYSEKENELQSVPYTQYVAQVGIQEFERWHFYPNVTVAREKVGK